MDEAGPSWVFFFNHYFFLVCRSEFNLVQVSNVESTRIEPIGGSLTLTCLSRELSDRAAVWFFGADSVDGWVKKNTTGSKPLVKASG